MIITPRNRILTLLINTVCALKTAPIKNVKPSFLIKKIENITTTEYDTQKEVIVVNNMKERIQLLFFLVIGMLLIAGCFRAFSAT